MANYAKHNHAKVSVNGQFLTGVQSFDYTRSDVTNSTRPFARNVINNYINDTPLVSLNINYIESNNSPSYSLFNTGNLTDHFTQSYNFKYEDNQGINYVSGAYLNNYNLSIQLNNPITTSLSFDCDETDFISGLSLEDDFNHSFGIYDAKLITISGDFSEGINTTGMCLQSVDFSLNATRRPILRLGDTIPQYRVVELPINCELSASLIRNSAALNQLIDRWNNNALLPSGSLNITIEDSNQNSITHYLPIMALNSIEESLDLNDNALITLNYIGTMNTGDYTVEPN